MPERNWTFKFDWKKWSFLLCMFVSFSLLIYKNLLSSAKLKYSIGPNCDCNVSTENPSRLKVLVLSYSRYGDLGRSNRVMDSTQVRVLSPGRTPLSPGLLLLLLRAAVAAQAEL